MKNLKKPLITIIIIIAIATIIANIERQINTGNSPIPVLIEPVSTVLKSDQLKDKEISEPESLRQERTLKNASLKSYPIRKKASHKKTATRTI
jgi:hypothetical protein